MKQKVRNTTIDIAKGIGIILVIVGHCVYFGGFVHNWIFSFHMPLFFILSGLFFKETKIFELVKKKTKQLLIPYLIFCAAGLLLTLVIPSWRVNFSIDGIIKDIYLGCPDCINVSSIWFLVCLFFTMIMLDILLIIKKKSAVLSYIFLGLTVVFGFLCSKITSVIPFLPANRLPLDIDCACVALLFLWLGFFFKNRILNLISKIEEKSIVLQCVLLIFALLLSVLMVFLNKRVNMHGLTYNNWILFVIGAISGFIAVILLSIIIKHFKVIKNWLIWFGRNTLKIIGVQAIVIRVYLLIANLIAGKQYELYFLPIEHVVLDCVFSTVLTGMIVTLFNFVRNRVMKRGNNIESKKNKKL